MEMQKIICITLKEIYAKGIFLIFVLLFKAISIIIKELNFIRDKGLVSLLSNKLASLYTSKGLSFFHKSNYTNFKVFNIVYNKNGYTITSNSKSFLNYYLF